MDNEPKASFSKQAIACMGIYCGSMTIGAGSAFSGVAGPQILETFNLSQNQISWFASLQTFATLFTCVLGGFLGEWLGRRLACQLVSPLFLVGFLCQALAPDIHLLYFGRIIVGAAVGLLSAPAGVYVSEITTSEWRTAFSSGLGAFYIVGSIVIFTLGKWVHWRTLAGISGIFPIGLFLILLFVPESPSWLVTQGRLSESKVSLAWLRGPNFNITKEFEHLQHSYKVTQENSTQNKEKGIKVVYRSLTNTLTQLVRPDVWKPLIIMLILLMVQQFCGIATITYYAVSVMASSGSAVNEYDASIIFSCVRLIGTSMGFFLLRRFRRRHLLVVSSLLTGFGMSLLGASAYLNETKPTAAYFNQTTSTNSTSMTTPEDNVQSDLLGYLPLIGVITAAVAYHIGLSPVPWSYTAELFPVDLRGRLSGVSNCMANIYIFVVIKSFPAVKESFGGSGAYWMYSCFGILAAIFGLTVLPETKGKSLAEVSDHFYVCCSGGKEGSRRDRGIYSQVRVGGKEDGAVEDKTSVEGLEDIEKCDIQT